MGAALRKQSLLPQVKEDYLRPSIHHSPIHQAIIQTKNCYWVLWFLSRNSPELSCTLGHRESDQLSRVLNSSMDWCVPSLSTECVVRKWSLIEMGHREYGLEGYIFLLSVYLLCLLSGHDSVSRSLLWEACVLCLLCVGARWPWISMNQNKPLLF